MNIALWIVQILLAGMYLMAGIMKTFQISRVRQMLPWTEGRTDSFIRFVGISELFGAVSLILPWATAVLPLLTPLAALGLALIQLLAIFMIHLPRKENMALPMNAILFALAIFVAYGRLFT